MMKLSEDVELFSGGKTSVHGKIYTQIIIMREIRCTVMLKSEK
jgi:hypothetical protein